MLCVRILCSLLYMMVFADVCCLTQLCKSLNYDSLSLSLCVCMCREWSSTPELLCGVCGKRSKHNNPTATRKPDQQTTNLTSDIRVYKPQFKKYCLCISFFFHVVFYLFLLFLYSRNMVTYYFTVRVLCTYPRKALGGTK